MEFYCDNPRLKSGGLWGLSYFSGKKLGVPGLVVTDDGNGNVSTADVHPDGYVIGQRNDAPEASGVP